MESKRSWAAVAFIALGLGLASPAAAVDPIYTGRGSDLAVSGYDPVAYFTEGRPVRGKAEFALEWMGARWHFASAAHRDLFDGDPEHYAPRYGGHCAYAVAHGSTASGDPEAWTIVDDRLYLNVSPSVRRLWLRDKEKFIQRADQSWPRLLSGG